MAVLLGLAAAATYGAADFVGGLVTRRTSALVVVVWSQLAGAALLAFMLPVLGGVPLTSRAVWWGVGAGLAGGVGVTLLYRGLAIGRMSVVAPVTAVGAATVPVGAGLALGERPSAMALAGVAVALTAIVLVSGAEEAAPALAQGRPGLPEAVGAGLAFGLFFVVLAQAGPGGGLWPLVGVRIGSVGIVLTAALSRRSSLRPTNGTWAPIVLAGILDMGANIFYLLAARQGLLSLVGVLTSLYPAATVLLAFAVLGERLRRIQVAGLGCAAAGVILIGLG